MEYKAEVYSALCSLSVFEINGKDADQDDFVNNYDHDQENAEDYACGDMRAEVLEATDSILGKYGITKEEFTTIAEDVAEKVSFGCCGWCV